MKRKKDSKTLTISKTRLRKSRDSRDDNKHDILIRNAEIWTPGGLRRGTILIENGKIKKIAKRIVSQSTKSIDASRLIAIPGLVDAHVHLRDLELGYKEDFTSGTAAAAAGGFTTILDMPNTKPSTNSASRLLEKQRIATTRSFVNLGFHAAAVGDQKEIIGLARSGAFSLKLYMPRPISNIDIEDDQVMLRTMRTASQYDVPLTVHAEDPDFFLDEEPRTFYEMAKFRRSGAETIAVDRILQLQEETACKTHFCHLTLPSSLDRINDHQSTKVSTEITPHHILLSDLRLQDLKWKAWMVPPLRPENVRKQLFKAAMEEEATIIASDHAPHTIAEKKRSPQNSLPGIPGLETTLRLLLTLVNKGALSISGLIRLLCINPKKIFGLDPGLLERGANADIVLIDPKNKNKIDSSQFFSKARYSPFDGYHAQGNVHSTIVNGTLIYNQGEILVNPGTGRVLKKG